MSKLWGPPGIVPWGVLVAEDHHLSLIRVQFQAIFFHPGGDAGRAIVEVGSDGGGVFGEGENELSVVSVGDYVESVGSYNVGQHCHVSVEEGGAEK